MGHDEWMRSVYGERELKPFSSIEVPAPARWEAAS